MSYNSLPFAAFSAAGLLLYYTLFRRAQREWLLVLSIAFLYAAGGAGSVFVLLLACGIAFAAGIGMERSSARPLLRVCWYGAAVFFELLLLAVFKYLDFPHETVLAVKELCGEEYAYEPLIRWAPVGISFYALMQISYLTDVYRGSLSPAHSLTSYGAYSALFLHILEGPVDRYDTLAPPFQMRTEPDGKRFFCGLLRILWGLFQKLVIAERLAVIVNAVYGDWETYSGGYLMAAAVCFSFQLYTDFSGCMDICCGVGQLFWLRLSENFRQPFFSRSCAEFWRRWHMTLGGWFKDYLMYPILRTRAFAKLSRQCRKRFGKKQGKKIPVCLSLLIVWSLLGLWHGGKWTYVIGSGLWHCLLMILSLLLEPLFDAFHAKTGIRRDAPLWVLWQQIRTFLLVSVGFVFFRSDSLTMAFSVFRGMAKPSGALFDAALWEEIGLSRPDAAVLVVSLLLLWAVSLKKEQRLSLRENAGSENEGGFDTLFWQDFCSNPFLLCLFSAALFFAVLLFGFYGQGYDASAFIYSKF